MQKPETPARTSTTRTYQYTFRLSRLEAELIAKWQAKLNRWNTSELFRDTILAVAGQETGLPVPKQPPVVPKRAYRKTHKPIRPGRGLEELD